MWTVGLTVEIKLRLQFFPRRSVGKALWVSPGLSGLLLKL